MQKVALVNSTIDTLKKYRPRDRTEPGLVALYDIRPGNRAGLFYSYNLKTRSSVTLLSYLVLNRLKNAHRCIIFLTVEANKQT